MKRLALLLASATLVCGTGAVQAQSETSTTTVETSKSSGRSVADDALRLEQKDRTTSTTKKTDGSGSTSVESTTQSNQSAHEFAPDEDRKSSTRSSETTRVDEDGTTSKTTRWKHEEEQKPN